MCFAVILLIAVLVALVRLVIPALNVKMCTQEVLLTSVAKFYTLGNWCTCGDWYTRGDRLRED